MEYGDRIGFLAISLEPDADVVGEAGRRLGLRLPLAVARSEMLAPFGVTGIPATILVTPEGRVVGTATGARSAKFFRRAAEDLLGGR